MGAHEDLPGAVTEREGIDTFSPLSQLSPLDRRGDVELSARVGSVLNRPTLQPEAVELLNQSSEAARDLDGLIPVAQRRLCKDEQGGDRPGYLVEDGPTTYAPQRRNLSDPNIVSEADGVRTEVTRNVNEYSVDNRAHREVCISVSVGENGQHPNFKVSLDVRDGEIYGVELKHVSFGLDHRRQLQSERIRVSHVPATETVDRMQALLPAILQRAVKSVAVLAGRSESSTSVESPML